MAQLHAERVSECCNLIVEDYLRRLTFCVVPNFENCPNTSTNHDRVVEDASKSLNVGNCFQQALYRAHLMLL